MIFKIILMFSFLISYPTLLQAYIHKRKIVTSVINIAIDDLNN
jgi:hypothetical protein